MLLKYHFISELKPNQSRPINKKDLPIEFYDKLYFYFYQFW